MTTWRDVASDLQSARVDKDKPSERPMFTEHAISAAVDSLKPILSMLDANEISLLDGREAQETWQIAPILCEATGVCGATNVAFFSRSQPFPKADWMSPKVYAVDLTSNVWDGFLASSKQRLLDLLRTNGHEYQVKMYVMDFMRRHFRDYRDDPLRTFYAKAFQHVRAHFFFGNVGEIVTSTLSEAMINYLCALAREGERGAAPLGKIVAMFPCCIPFGIVDQTQPEVDPFFGQILTPESKTPQTTFWSVICR
ncbi:MAG TPA: hypothetical protein VFQ60_04730 [Patescibacteria group bacterium]|nr:hypothetical protein [Patescibacteria group bacterium]